MQFRFRSTLAGSDRLTQRGVATPVRYPVSEDFPSRDVWTSWNVFKLFVPGCIGRTSRVKSESGKGGSV